MDMQTLKFRRYLAWQGSGSSPRNIFPSAFATSKQAREEKQGEAPYDSESPIENRRCSTTLFQAETIPARGQGRPAWSRQEATFTAGDDDPGYSRGCLVPLDTAGRGRAHHYRIPRVKCRWAAGNYGRAGGQILGFPGFW